MKSKPKKKLPAVRVSRSGRHKVKVIRTGSLPEWANGEEEPSDKIQPYDFSSMRDSTKRRREVFVHEYIKDFNGSAAVQRMGFTFAHPHVQAYNWLQEPYTQYYLAKFLKEADDKAIVSRNSVLAGLLREANCVGEDGSHAARISAWRALAKILGMEITKVEGSLTLGGGVMTIPLSGSPEEWEKQAEAAQAKLKAAVRT